MSLRMRDALAHALPGLRHEPTPKRIRARLGDRVVVDSTRAVLVWEPSRLVPSFAVPREHVRAELVPAAETVTWFGGRERLRVAGHAVLDPSFPFAVHTAAGEALSVRANGHRLEGAAFRPTDPDLDGLVLLDCDAFDSWYEEASRCTGTRATRTTGSRSSRARARCGSSATGSCSRRGSRVQMLVEGTVLPVRHYLPARGRPRARCAPAPPAPAARTRARRPTGRPRSAATRSTTSRGATTSRCARPRSVAGLNLLLRRAASTSTGTARPQERPLTPWGRTADRAHQPRVPPQASKGPATSK